MEDGEGCQRPSPKMRLGDVAVCIACVALSAVGQVMLRSAAMVGARSSLAWPLGWLNGLTLAALCVYFLAMLLWVWVLSRVPLTQAFAFFGLSFLLVPLLAHLWLGDRVTIFTWLGGTVIIAGIAITNWPR